MGLFTPKWKHADEEVRIAAIENTEKPGALEKIALNGLNYKECLMAVEKLSDQERLKRVAVSTNRYKGKVGIEAAKKIDNEEQLETIVKEAELVEVKVAAVKQISRQSMLYGVIIGDEDFDVKFAAFENITEPDYLEGIAESGLAPEGMQGLARQKISQRVWEKKHQKKAKSAPSRVVLCCPNEACSGMVSSSDENLKIHLQQLSRGGMIGGTGITCNDCGVHSDLNSWHKETVRKYGDNYLERGDEIFNSVNG